MDDEISPANSPATSPTPPKGLIAYKQEQLFHMGPLPAPADFEIYEKTVPGAGDRILKMAEHEQSLRHEIERKRMDATDDDAKERRRLERRGQWFGFFIAILALVIGGYLALHDKTTSAGILLGGTIVALVATFVGEKARPRKNPAGANRNANGQ